MIRHIGHGLCALIVFLLVLSCGGGGDSSSLAHTTIQGTGTGTSKSIAISGTIDQFGSIYVGGVQFSVDNISSLKLDEVAASTSSLHTGMWVTLSGTISSDGETGIASEINYQSHFAGSITRMNKSSSTFVLKSVTISYDDETRFASPMAESHLAVDSNILVSGYYTDDSHFKATYIAQNTRNLNLHRQAEELRPDLSSSESIGLSGAVRNLGNDHFTLNGYSIQMTEQTSLSGLSDALSNGDHVHVIGTPQNESDIEASSIHIFSTSEEFERTSGSIQTLNQSTRRLSINSITYQINRYTRYTDQSSDSTTQFGFSDLNSGDQVRIDFFIDSRDGSRIVTRLSRLSSSSRQDSRD